MNTNRTAATVKPWTPYVPTNQAPWDLRRVVHLHRRAGFAATWAEIQRDLKDGPRASIDRLFAGKSRMSGVPDDFATVANTLVQHAADLDRLKAWWIYRMLCGPDPLTERLVLMWHNHFATSAAKVGMAVRRQNEILRTYVRAPFGELLRHVVHDPALLVWLDAQANRKGYPNENLGRELMELFTLGVGHYTEKDVKEAARALTGWTVDKNLFKEDAALHDAGGKTILGKRGAWKGDDLVRILLDQPATAERLAMRLCECFMGEGAIDGADVKALGAGLRAHQLDLGWAVDTVLRSHAFFAEANLGSRILGPAEFVIGAVRALELLDPPPNTLILAEFVTNLGQNLFFPPNVGGWPGGRSWINTRSAIGRYNYALALVGGVDVGRGEPLDPMALARRHGRPADLESIIAFAADLIRGSRPDAAWVKQLRAALGRKRADLAQNARQAVALVLASPEAQLG